MTENRTSDEPRKVHLGWPDVERLAKAMLADVPLSSLPDHGANGIFVYGVPRGGIPAAQAFVYEARSRGFDCRLVGSPDVATVFVDDIIDTGNTRLRYKRQFGDRPFVALVNVCDGREVRHRGHWFVFPWEAMADEGEGPEDNVRRLIQFVGEDPEREGLHETPGRVLRAWEFLCSGYKQDPSSVLKTFTEGACDEMVVLKDIEFYSTCEHHMLPFFGKAHIGYIPDGRVVGISKLARLLEVYARRLQIQERIGQQITLALEAYLKPKGCACVLEAQHFCMTSRGVQKQNSIMVTSSLTGAFLRGEVRSEFLRLIGR